MESRIRTGFSEGWGSDESELSSRREPKASRCFYNPGILSDVKEVGTLTDS